MKETIKSLRVIVKGSKASTMRASKAMVLDTINADAKAINELKQDAIPVTLKAIDDSKTKVNMLINIEKLITLLSLSIKDPDAIKQANHLSHMLDLSVRVKLAIDAGQNAFMQAGMFLSEGLAAIKENKGKQSDFLVWADSVCNIKKAQAYKLMSVYNEYGDKSEFKAVSMRVLYTLKGQDKKVIEESTKLAKAGKLDTKALDRIIVKHAPVKTVSTPATKGSNGGTVVPKATVKVPENNETIESLIKTVKGLNTTIEDLNSQLIEARKPKAVVRSIIPALAQFDSTCMHTRLGLEEVNKGDKTAINKAYRALAKIWTGASNKEASDKLITARQALLNSL